MEINAVHGRGEYDVADVIECLLFYAVALCSMQR